MDTAKHQNPAPMRLIYASRVNGTAVFNTAGQKIGHIEDVAINKLDGSVAYAILFIGGFLGTSGEYHPLPWSALSYDVEKNGYIVPFDKEQLRLSPSYTKDELADVGDADERYAKPVSDYFGPFI